MSVECEAKLIYGFMVDSYAAEELYNRDKDLYNEFISDDYTYCMDHYVDNPLENLYAFGLTEGWAEPGEMFKIPVIRGYNSKHFLDMMDLYKKYFPNQKDYVPHDYMCCILN